jgi:hypothetical protein
MIGIYINFNNNGDLEKVENELQEIGGYEVGGNGPNEPCWLLCSHSPEDKREVDECVEYEEAQEIRAIAEAMLNQNGLKYSITESA